MKDRHVAPDQELVQSSIRLPIELHLALGHVVFVHDSDMADEIRTAVSAHLNNLREDPEFIEMSEERIRQSRAAFFGN
jgi:hypothetical protein